MPIALQTTRPFNRPCDEPSRAHVGRITRTLEMPFPLNLPKERIAWHGVAHGRNAIHRPHAYWRAGVKRTIPMRNDEPCLPSTTMEEVAGPRWACRSTEAEDKEGTGVRMGAAFAGAFRPQIESAPNGSGHDLGAPNCCAVPEFLIIRSRGDD
jgi:hypothetical protein